MNTIIERVKYLLPCLLLTAGLAACGGDDNGAGNGNNGGIELPSALVGKVLPDWEEGNFDIHMINTGRGESLLHIFPDGTTMLIDAAGSLLEATADIPPTDSKPNDNITSGQVILNYVNHFTRAANGKLDYLMLTHYDTDHMGGYVTTDKHAEGNFYKIGITEVGSGIQVDNLIDRGYSYPRNRSGETRIANYISFSQWSQQKRGTVYQEFDVGSDTQIALKYNPSKYAGFAVRNIFGNGYVWTGAGNEKRNTFPSTVAEITAADPSENIYSLAIHVKYGRFDYFTGGDLQYNDRSNYPWKDVEAPVAAVMGQVEVMKANHHATSNCNGTAILNALKPQAILINSWRDVHPQPTTLATMYGVREDCNIFINNTTAANKVRLADYLSKLRSLEGHIVVRVKGDELNTFAIYVLDDKNEDYKVVKGYGPYFSY